MMIIDDNSNDKHIVAVVRILIILMLMITTVGRTVNARRFIRAQWYSTEPTAKHSIFASKHF